MAAQPRCAATECRHSLAKHEGGAACYCGCRQFLRRKRHAWREYVTEVHALAYYAWELEAEAATMGYPTEMKEYREQCPSPKFRDTLVALRQPGPDDVV